MTQKYTSVNWWWRNYKFETVSFVPSIIYGSYLFFVSECMNWLKTEYSLIYFLVAYIQATLKKYTIMPIMINFNFFSVAPSVTVGKNGSPSVKLCYWFKSFFPIPKTVQLDKNSLYDWSCSLGKERAKLKLLKMEWRPLFWNRKHRLKYRSRRKF